MKRVIVSLILSLFAFFTQAALANEGPSQAASTANQVKLELLDKLVADSYLTPASAAEATKRYVTEDKPIAGASEESSWVKYVSLINIVKVVAVLFLLIAFAGTIKKIIKGLWGLITMVPTFVYQGLLLSSTVLGTLYPETYWASQSFYVALFCAFANLAIIGWVLQYYPKVAQTIARFFSLGIKPELLAAFYTMLYFTALTFAYSSQVFGFFAVASLSAVFGFGMVYMPGVLYLDAKEKMLGSLVVSHMVILVGYCAAVTMHVPFLSLFAAGFEYYCAIGLGVGLIIGASPFYGRGTGKYVLAAIVALILANIGFAMGFKSIGSIIDIFGFLLLAEWVLYMGFMSGSVIFGCLVAGVSLYGTAMFLQANGQAILQALKLVG